jgi:3-hydroxy-3-methylglutaryl CoA synthase
VPEVVGRLLEETGTRLRGSIISVSPGTLTGISAAVAKRLGFKPESAVDNLAARCGDTGAAHPPDVTRDRARDCKPGQRILLAGFGTGCDALLFEATEAIGGYRSTSPVSVALARGVTDKSYNKLLSFSDELDLDWGMRAETDAKTALTQLYRSRDQVVAFVGGRCAECGTIQFPRMRHACAVDRRRRCRRPRSRTRLPRSRLTRPTG